MLIYTGLLALIAAALVIAVLLRVPLKLDVLRDRNSLFRELYDGHIENVYTLKVMNMDSQAHNYIVSASGIKDLKLQLDKEPVHVASGEVADVPVRLQAEPGDLSKRSTPVEFVVTAEDDPKLTAGRTARFLGPAESGHENDKH